MDLQHYLMMVFVIVIDLYDAISNFRYLVEKEKMKK